LIAFVIPGDLETPTGGYVYDRRIIDGLRASGVDVEIRRLSARFPFPDETALRAAAGELASIPDGAVVVVDGLAGGAMPDELQRESKRLRIVALVHHPLARETGLLKAQADDLEQSERRALEFVRHVIVTSTATAELLSREFGVDASRVTVVEPGTDPATRAAGSPERPVELLCVASITPRKGHVTLVRALGRLRDLEWHLTCVGGERDRETAEQVKREVVQAGLADRVTFVGELRRRQDVDPHYDRADVFVLATEYEGYGMAVAEALARGLPVVSTPTGGITRLVGTEAGILVPAGDVAELARALRRIVSDKRERDRLREGAWRAGSALATWDAAAAKFAAVLSRV
jgi:glycosyltransferase involved in cell wall biosynthesis